MARPNFPRASTVNRYTPMQEGGSIAADLFLRATSQISRACDQIMEAAEAVGYIDGTDGADATILALAKYISEMNDKFMSYFDDSGDEYPLHELAHAIFPRFQKAEEELDKLLNRSALPAPSAPAQGVVLSPQAVADIDVQLERTENAVELLLQSIGEQDAALVNILEFAKQGYAQAKEVDAFEDTWHRLIEVDSVIQAAIALADTSKGTPPRAIAALRDLKSFSDALMDKFDGGIYAIEHQRSQSSNVVRKELKQAVFEETPNA